MFWKVEYVIDTVYAINSRVCIIREVSKERALKVFKERVASQLKGEKFVVEKYTKVTQCENDTILYDGVC